jgi:glutamyl-tRNA synthetase
MNDQIRVRFAPSPTGYMHVGNARTAIFNWLFARHHGGSFILRIEDTDRSRHTEAAVQVILDGLRWLGMDWDEGPVFQSERLEMYRAAALRLVESGHAYHCYCTPEELKARRGSGTEEAGWGYDGTCRKRTEPRPGVTPAIRLRTPDFGITVLDDLIQGRIETSNAEIDDRIILRSDGSPTYNLSCVVDDNDMRITHVIRGADHLTNTPFQIQLYRAFGWEPPRFAHQGLILGTDRSKLSKRHGAVKVTDYHEEGFLPEALFNALVRLGWSHGDQEIFERDELIRLFELDKVSRAPAIFDFEKIRNLFNHHSIRAAAPERVRGLLSEQLAALGLDVASDDPRLVLLVEPLSERSRTMREMAEQAKVMLAPEVVFEDKARAKHCKPAAAPIMKALADRLEGLPADADGEAIMACFHAVAEELGVGMGKVAQPARVAMIGTDRSPGIDIVVKILGLDRAVARIRALAATIEMEG